MASGKSSMSDSVDSVLTYAILGWGGGGGRVTALSDIYENEELSTTGLKKPCLVRLSTHVNNISIELKAVRQKNSWSQWQKKKKKKKKDGGKEEELRTNWGGRRVEGVEKQMAEYSGKCHPCQTNQNSKICKYLLSQVRKYCPKTMPPS